MHITPVYLQIFQKVTNTLEDGAERTKRVLYQVTSKCANRHQMRLNSQAVLAFIIFFFFLENKRQVLAFIINNRSCASMVREDKFLIRIISFKILFKLCKE